MESIIDAKKEFSEEDQLIIKKAELRILKKYNQFSMGFIFSAIAVAILNGRNTKFSYIARFLPAFILIPFIGVFHKNIGMYGVH